MLLRVVAGCAVLMIAWGAAPLEAREQSLGGHVFTLPDGFVIERIAGPPLVERPITLDWDEQGRLYVAESSGSNDKVEKQLAERPHRIVRLEDVDGDGRFDKQVVFADKMMLPQGTLWHAGSLYVAAPPSIWKLTDTNGDGVADRREEWFAGKTLTGCANDLHGPYLGRDGRIYWCKGAFAEQQHDRPGKEPWKTRAAHIFRARPDGSLIEPVMTGGMDNPVDVVFTANGERIFTTTFFQHPGGGQRDGLIHAVYGGVYGKDHDVLAGHPRTGNLMPVLTHMGPAAPAGLAVYDGTNFGREFTGNLFAAQFNLHKVSRHVLSPREGSFETRDSDFVSSNQFDFHPTDVQEDADGSLVVVDTGGWYKLCCPSSQLWKPDIRGAIYRVRREGATKTADPRGLKLPWDAATAVAELMARLRDERPVVRRRATEELAKRGAAVVPELAAQLAAAKDQSAQRREILWTLARMDHADARQAVRTMLEVEDDDVRQVAAHVAGLWRDRAAVELLLKSCRQGSPSARRAAAEALGRCGDPTAIAPLLASVDNHRHSRVMFHSLLYAVWEIGAVAETRQALASAGPLGKAAGLMVLEQLPGGNVSVDDVLPLLASGDPEQLSLATWIIQRHPDWSGRLGTWARDFVKDAVHRPQSRERSTAIALLSHPAVYEAAAGLLASQDTSRATRMLLVGALYQANRKQLSPTMAAALRGMLAQGDEPSATVVVALLGRMGPEKNRALWLDQELLAEVVRREAFSWRLRIAALAACRGDKLSVPAGVVEALLDHLTREPQEVERSLVIEALGKVSLDREQLQRLTAALPQVPAIDCNRVLELFRQSRDEQVGLQLVATLAKLPAVRALRVDALKEQLKDYSPAVHQAAEKLYAQINVDAAAQRERLEAILPLVKSGDIRRGQAVFHSTKTACAACHALGYVGGTIGPDLTRVGAIRSERDLLEAILFPSASFVRSYEPVAVRTVDGHIHQGLVQRNDGNGMTLITGAKERVELSRKEIDEVQPGTVSIMPAGLDQQLTPQELADLVAFLKAAK